jgi:hypothetical protein
LICSMRDTPQEAFIRIFTDGSATTAVWRGGAGGTY